MYTNILTNLTHQAKSVPPAAPHRPPAADAPVAAHALEMRLHILTPCEEKNFDWRGGWWCALSPTFICLPLRLFWPTLDLEEKKLLWIHSILDLAQRAALNSLRYSRGGPSARGDYQKKKKKCPSTHGAGNLDVLAPAQLLLLHAYPIGSLVACSSAALNYCCTRLAFLCSPRHRKIGQKTKPTRPDKHLRKKWAPQSKNIAPKQWRACKNAKERQKKKIAASKSWTSDLAARVHRDSTSRSNSALRRVALANRLRQQWCLPCTRHPIY